MSDSSLHAKIDLVLSSQAELRDDVRVLSRTQSDHMVAIAEELKALALSNLDMHNGLAHANERADEHSRDLASQAAEVAEIKRQQAWIRAWSAGALAVVVTVGGGLVWFVTTLPIEVWSAIGKGGK